MANLLLITNDINLNEAFGIIFLMMIFYDVIKT